MAYKLSKAQIKKVVANGSKKLYDYCRDNNIHYVVTGSSGGLDSAVTLGFAARACQLARKDGFALTSVGLIMPCHSCADAGNLGQKAIEKFGAQEIYIDLTSVCDFITEEIPHLNAQIRKVLKTTKGQNSLNNWSWSEKISSGNIKARLRMMLGTYHVARMLGGMVLSTDNLSEYMMGFWTINGDVGDFGIIQHVFKGLELYDVARYLGVPKEIIAAKPDDGLGVAGGDEDQLGAAYPILDQVMIRQIQAGFDLNGGWEQMKTLKNIKGVPEKVVKRLCERALGTAYKRRGTITLNREDLGLPPIKKIKL